MCKFPLKGKTDQDDACHCCHIHHGEPASSLVSESWVTGVLGVTSQMHGEPMIHRVTAFHQRAIFYKAHDVIFHTTCQAFPRKLQRQNKPYLSFELLMKSKCREMDYDK